MKPDDVALDQPCQECNAAVGMPCMSIVRTSRGPSLVERGLPHSSRRAAAVARANSSAVPVVEPPAATSVDADGLARGAAEGRPFGNSTEPPLPTTASDGTVPPDASAALSLPLIELECGHPASEQQAYRALQFPDADVWCWLCQRYTERRAS